MKKIIISFGELLWDILPTHTILGGAPFNFAYRVNSIGDIGIMISRLGRDDLGRQAFEKVVSLGLATKYLQWDDHYPTGTVDVRFDAANNPDYVINPHVAYDHIELNDNLISAISSADCICFGTLVQRSETSRQTLIILLQESNNLVKFLDINLRKKCYNIETITYSLIQADVLKLNEDEAYNLAEILHICNLSIPQFCDKVIEEWSLEYCIVTLAERGAFARSKNGEEVYSPGYRINLVDSLGSGDAFSAGFVHKILRGKSVKEACEYGNLLGAIVATQEGATVTISMASIEQFKKMNYDRNIDKNLEPYIKE